MQSCVNIKTNYNTPRHLLHLESISLFSYISVCADLFGAAAEHGSPGGGGGLPAGPRGAAAGVRCGYHRSSCRGMALLTRSLPADHQRVTSGSPAGLQPVSSGSPADLQRVTSGPPAGHQRVSSGSPAGQQSGVTSRSPDGLQQVPSESMTYRRFPAYKLYFDDIETRR